jgi:hypothetical protein
MVEGKVVATVWERQGGAGEWKEEEQEEGDGLV